MSYRETAADLQRKWLETFCLYDGEICYVHSFGESPDSRQIVGVLGNSNTEAKELFVLAELFQPLDIPNGFYNLPMECQGRVTKQIRISGWGLKRNPRRSATRGLTHQTFFWKNLCSEFLPNFKGGYSHPEWGFDVLKPILKPTYPNYHRARESIKETRFVALNRHWGIGVPLIMPPDPEALLFANTAGFCGWAYPDKLVIKHRGSYQEAMDFVRRANLNLAVYYDAG